MVFSGREIVKFVVFIFLVGLVVFYVASNREHLFDNFSAGSAGRPAAGGGQGQLDLDNAEVIPVGAFGSGTAGPGGASGRSADSGEALGGMNTADGAATGGGGGLTVAAGAGNDLFVEFRLQREQARSEQLDLLREVLNNPNLEQGARDQALALWLSITKSVAQEVDVENLIRAKGFADAVVVLAEGKATVMVKAASLSPEEVLRVADIAVRVAGLSYEDITVIVRGG